MQKNMKKPIQRNVRNALLWRIIFLQNSVREGTASRDLLLIGLNDLSRIVETMPKAQKRVDTPAEIA